MENGTKLSTDPVMKFMRSLLLIPLLSLLAHGSVVGQTLQVVEQETRDYYSQWIGARAPEFVHPLRNRYDDFPKLKLRDFEGKRLLLFSFDTGNFVDAAGDEGETTRLLATLQKEMKQSTNVAVIGFTSGPMFFGPGIETPNDLKDVTEFPLVNITELARDPLQEPYNLLQRWPSLLVVDKRGVIAGIYPPPLQESNIVSAFAISDMAGAVRLPLAQAPPQSVANWSSRKFWVIFAYTRNLEPGSEFKKEFGAMKRVYFADEVPVDEVLGRNAFVGKKLKRTVKSGEAMRKSDFLE